MYANVCLLCVKKETEGVKNIEEARTRWRNRNREKEKERKKEGRNVLRYNLLA